MTELVAFLREKGFEIAPILDGSFQRFDRAGVLSGWLTGKTYNLSGQEVVVARFGDWKTDERHEFKSSEVKGLTTSEREQMNQALMEAATREREARERVQEEVARECQEMWAGMLVGDENQEGSWFRNQYLERKGLGGRGLYGCRLHVVRDAVLLAVPARDIFGKLWGIQFINNDGTKNFKSGMRIQGCFHLIGAEIKPGDTVYVCEGVATGASIHEATRSPAVCVFNAGNLPRVARQLAERYGRDCKLVLCGDDDRWTTKGDGTAWNPGREKALEAGKLAGARVVFPRFSDDSTRPTDFNDLHVLEGLDSVRTQLEAATTGQGGGLTAPAGGEGTERSLEPLAWGTTKRGTPVPPTDQQVADALLDFYDSMMVKQEEDLFLYCGTHWCRLGTHEKHALYNQIQELYSGNAGASKIEQIFKLFLFKLPAAPMDMFQPRVTCANFLNGTLHAVRGDDYKYKLEFRPHAREDYLTSVIPLRYAPQEGARNEEFLSMLARVFEGEPDRDEKIVAVQEMYGACLMPLYPHLFLLHGPQGSGKSSLILPAQRLVHRDNWCSVEPHEFNGFLMESMVGKLVNIVTDIRITQPIDDANLKKIEDRVPVRIDRKYEKSIYAPFPATHIFGANGIPPTLDGSSGAHTRRWTFIELSKYRATEGAYRKDYSNWMFDQSPEGVLNFALEGLQRLVTQEGHFTNPASGKARLRSWQTEHDPVALFLQAIEEDELDQNTRLFFHPDARVQRSVLWQNFSDWVQKSETRFKSFGRNRFFFFMESKGFRVVSINGKRHFTGIGVGTQSDAAF